LPVIRVRPSRRRTELNHLSEIRGPPHTFDTIEELRCALQDFIAHYNTTWLVARHGYRTPNQIRAEQRKLAEHQLANLPLAA
jgi:hypothetical protein